MASTIIVDFQREEGQKLRMLFSFSFYLYLDNASSKAS